MRLFAGTSQQFIQDSIQNQISEKLRFAFINYFRHNPSPSEIQSWRNSLRAISQVFQYANFYDQGIILEYQLPLNSKRLDCLICGRDVDAKDNAVIIELKQWAECEEGFGEKVITWLGGKREVLHPSVQVGQYKMLLEDNQSAFYEDDDPIKLNACTYLHNYYINPDDVLLSEKFSNVLANYPLFSADDVEKLKDFLINKVNKGNGIDVLRRIEESKFRPSKKLMDHISGVIDGKSEYVLLDEQLIVYEKVMACAKQGFHDKQKTVIIVKGGPGTGKSVIAMNLLGGLLQEKYNAHYVTGSKAFTQTLRKKIGNRGSIQFKYFNSYVDAQDNEVDVLIADESHRLRPTSTNRFTPKNKRTNFSQIEELIKAAKVCVFFIDDYQIVRPNEIGSAEYIKENASQKNCKVFEYKLETQFRCAGSESFVNWINNTLEIEKTPDILWNKPKEFDFKIFETPLELENAIRQKVNVGNTGRITAGFCWKWSNPNNDGTLTNDVVIGDYKRPWNAKSDNAILSPEIPKAELWADDPKGLNQIGCVYTAMGFEFDYEGIIFGNDLKYDFDRQEWIGHPENSEDTVVKRSKEKFVTSVKNTYRVLFSRGMKGCYVYFMDKDTERFFKSRIEKI
jgi:uncharacterized protein